MNQIKHVFIGIPSRDGKLSAALHRWVSALSCLSATGQLPFKITEFIAEGYSPVHYARNIICGAAMKTDADRILMVDDDMLPDPTTFKLFASSSDIVVPRMFRFRHNGPIAASEEDNRPPEIATCATFVQGDGENEKRLDIVPTLDADGEVAVQAAGTGLILINRKIIDDPRMLVGEPDQHDGTPALFRMIATPTGRITEWEDVDFTLRAHRLGYKVSAHFGAHCGHRKAVNLDAVFEMVYRGNASEVLVGMRG